MRPRARFTQSFSVRAALSLVYGERNSTLPVMMEVTRWKTVILMLAVSCVDRARANCLLSLRLDLTHNQPLVLSTVTDSWYPLDTSPDGAIALRRDETVRLVCPAHPSHSQPNAFAAFPGRGELLAKCERRNEFRVDGKSYSFDRLQCTQHAVPTAAATGKSCLSPQNELYKVGYPAGSGFAAAFEVCYDKRNKGPVYTEWVLSPDYYKSDPRVRAVAWTHEAGASGAPDTTGEYTCAGQAETFRRILGKKYFAEDDKCCYAQAQLAPSGDFALAPQRSAAYHSLNSVPQWSTCNNRDNWVEVERRVRQLASSLQRPLRVWAGSARAVRLRTEWLLTSADVYMHYNSDDDKAIPVPLYIWKVVHDPQTRKSLAIIQINKPNLSLAEVDGYKLCPDVCHNVNWMNFLKRQNIGSGYLYCCDLNDFEFAFQFKSSPFPPNSGKILRDETSSTWSS